MGWRSTMDITVDDARKVLLSKIFDAKEEDLASMLEAALPDRIYNFRIVDRYSENPDDRADQYSPGRL